ncbi:Uncharacterised protein [Mycobacterium tuberculosis]|nr:Uncharacterised protein [Mycobacterium tuberculosis]
MATGRQLGALNVLLGQGALPHKGAVLTVNHEVLVLVSHEVEDRQNRLQRCTAQTAAQLLQEERERLGGAQHQERVDARNVDALVEQVHGEDRGQLVRFVCKVFHDFGAAFGGIRTHQEVSGNTHLVELLRHVFGVLHTHAEPERLHAQGVVDLLAQLLHDDAQAAFSLALGVQVFQGVLVVFAASNVDAAQVGAVGNTEVLEGYEEVVFERIPQTN